MMLITVADICKLIRTIGIQAVFSQVIDQLHDDFLHWDEFDKSPRHATHVPQGVMELMPIAGPDYYAFKYVNGHPNNPQSNKQTVVALGMLADVQTGYPLMISEMTLLTAIRTAATAALAARYLAKKDATTLALIGTGSQSEFLALALQVALGINTIYYTDIDSQAMEKFAKNLQPYSFYLIPVQSAREAVMVADVIVTATAAKRQAHILENAWLRDGQCILGIGGDCPDKTELDPDILERAKIVVEYLSQTRHEGEIQQLNNHTIYAELWEIISGKTPGREHADDIMLFDSVGFALEDYSILKYIYTQSQQHAIGHAVDLIAAPENPKDLFSML